MMMPLGVPDEFVRGLLNSLPAMWQAVAAAYGKELAGPRSAATDDPPRQAQLWYLRQQAALWAGVAATAVGVRTEPVAAPERGDRRFSADEWRDHPFYGLKVIETAPGRYVKTRIAAAAGRTGYASA
jgi:polyhydroxyalkanoate synthase